MHDSDFVTILICTTTTNPTTTKKGAELGKNPTQHSLTPFGQSRVVLARSQKTIRNLQVFFACKLDHRRPWFWKIVCAESPYRSAVVFFFSKTPSGFTEPAADHTSISRNLEMVVANTLWSWRLQWNMILILDQDNSLLWRISFTFCLLFYLPRHFRLPEIYPMSIYVENMRCADVMTPFFRHSPAQSKTPLCGKEHTLLFNMSQRNMCQCVNDVSKPTPHHRIHIR